MKVVVSGARGFIGSNLLKALKGQYEFVSLDIDDFENPKKIDESFTDAEVLIHLAGLSSIAESEKDVYKTYKVNVALTGFLVDRFYKLNPHGRVIFSSTGQVYDSTASLPLKVDSSLDPSSTYSRTKLAAEAVVTEIASAYKSRATILRFFNISHKSQRPDFFLPSVFTQIQNSKEDTVVVNVGNIDISRDFSSIQDVIRVFKYSLDNPQAELNQLENVCSGVPKSLREIVTTMAKRMNKSIEIRIDSARVREGEAKSNFGFSKFSTLGLMRDGQSVESFVDAFLSDVPLP